MAASESLPTQRELLTALINTLTSTLPPPPNHYSKTSCSDTFSPNNPLGFLKASHRALLMTLHVVFPPPMLLQALDLLDRRLITRFIQNADTEPDDTKIKKSEEYIPTKIRAQPPSPEPIQVSTSPVPQPQQPRRKTKQIYQIRSSQAPKSKFRDGTGFASKGNNIYIVHLEAWNCSCAAFAFSAFPPSTFSRSKPWLHTSQAKNTAAPGMKFLQTEEGDILKRTESEQWTFGGISLEQQQKEGTGHVPVCKHLLGCLLGQRWDSVLGFHVQEKKVGKEEMAGVVSEG